ncbi:hypothetical protein QEN19_002888 [Hanseniaspora menglaensis]
MNTKHSKPTTKDICDIYEQYSSLNKDVINIIDALDISESEKTASKVESRIIELKDIDCAISLYYDNNYFYLNNYVIEVSVLDECFESFNNLLSGKIIPLLKSNNSCEPTDSFTPYIWRDLINNNQLLLFLSIFNFYIDNPLTFIFDKMFKDFVLLVNNVFINKNYDICSLLQYILPSGIYDISKKPEIITNSEHFMDKVSEILIINHLMSGVVYFFDESINILVLLDLYFYNNKKMDYTRHVNMKLYKKILEKIYINFDMRNHSSSLSTSKSLTALTATDLASLQKKIKTFPLSNLLFTMKQKNMNIDDECKTLFLNWFSKIDSESIFLKSNCRISYCETVIEQLITLFQINNISVFDSAKTLENPSLNNSFMGFNLDLSKNKMYETFYKIMKCPPTKETATINLKILKKNVSNLITFESLENQMIWLIDQEIKSPLSLLQLAANKFLFKAAYYSIHQSYLKFVSGKCFKEEKFKEIYEFINLSRFNGLNTTFNEDQDILSTFKISSNDFVKEAFSIKQQPVIKTLIPKTKKTSVDTAPLENINETKNKSTSKSILGEKSDFISPKESLKNCSKNSRIKLNSLATDPYVSSLIPTSSRKNKVSKINYFETSSNILNLQLTNALDFDNTQLHIKKESFELDLNQYIQTMGLELA